MSQLDSYAIIESGEVVNIVEWDGNTSTWEPPTGSTWVELSQDNAYLYVIGQPAPPQNS
jgi:hypothetical protein